MPTPRLDTLLATRFEERGGVVSPDGRWLAYESDSSGRQYDVSADGRRFLMLKESNSQKDVANLVVVQNWHEELKRLVPTN